MAITLRRIAWAVIAATAYQIATNPFILAALLCFWHWQAGLALLVIYTAGCLGAVLTSHIIPSPLTGQFIVNPYPGSLFSFFGNIQDGLYVDWHRAKYPKRLKFLAPFMWTWWRNKLRNLPFVPGLRWLHRVPNKPEVWRYHKVGPVPVELYWHGWMTELKASSGNWFLDIGPRLDQPSEWGAVSWAYRIGRV